MKLKLLRIAPFIVATLFATGLTAQEDVFNADFGIGGGGGVGSWKTCLTNGGGAHGAMGCVTPDSGGWGTDACWVDSYPEQTYCFSVGHDCCVD
ncbi:MAG TPA: hypothetical protein VGQ46_03555 [Thermoanaerobaculia bacterium]|jgi:hypothetical protein|nr:hypothetical protein [Thermoanaerobaculia bacterium]